MSAIATASETIAPSHGPNSGAAHADSLRIGRVPLAFFAVSVIFFAIGVCAIPFAVPYASGFFYQAIVIAVVHTFTLGWITAAIMGVMYRYVPALTRVPIRSSRLAYAQLVIFTIGVSGMIVHFAIGAWIGLWLAAIAVVVSIVMFAANLVPCLWREFGRGVAETGMLLATGFLLIAATLGTILGLDKTYDFLPGNVLTNLSAHVHLAAVGWVTMAICAVSYRMLPAFLLPKATLPRHAIWQLYALAAAVSALAISLFFGLRGETIFAIAIAAAMGWYIAIIARMAATRRMPLDWTPRHALTGVASLAIALALGITLTRIGGDSVWGARIAPAYGVAGLLGFFSNFIIGVSYKLFPAFVTRARQGRGWPAVTIDELSIVRARWFVFGAFNGGVVLMIAGFLAGAPDLTRAGAILTAAGGVVYSATTLWTLSFALRAAAQSSSAQTSLRVLPE
ncbi:MAG TPA: cbb3-type cytochrome c oxidase subunit I [Candidatus Binataceae bacterium]|nr:cbb3-type cytochrome c oxidase subunit I [Candidatus Binataceae bacterium]